MNLIYGVHDKPKFGQMLVFAFQQVLAILAATIAVPSIIGNGLSQSAALFGAVIGTLIYGGAASASAGYAGLIIGAAFAALVYVIIALVVKFVGVNWINKLMPPVVIGPTVAIIGLSLAGNAVGDLTTGRVEGCSLPAEWKAAAPMWH